MQGEKKYLYFGLVLTLVLTNYFLLPLLPPPLPVPARPPTFWTSLAYTPSISAANHSSLYTAVQVQLCHSAQWLKHKQLYSPEKFSLMVFSSVSNTRLLQHNLDKHAQNSIINFLGLPSSWAETSRDWSPRKKVPALHWGVFGSRQTNDCLSAYGLNSISRLYHRDAVIKWASGKPGSLQWVKTIVLSLSLVMYCMSDRLTNGEWEMLEILKRY